MATFGQTFGLVTPFEDFPGFFLKCFKQGTTTPISMATDSTGGTLLAKAEVSSGGLVQIGFFKTDGNVIFNPHLAEAYDAFLFPTEAEADANNTTNAIQLADDLTPAAVVAENTVRSLTNINFDDVADMVANGVDLKLGDWVSLEEHTVGNGSGVLFGNVVGAGTGTADNGSFIDLPNTLPDPLQFKQNFPEIIATKMFGVIADGVTEDAIAAFAAIDYVYLVERTLKWSAGITLINSTKTMGKTVADAAKHCHFVGEHNQTVIKTTAANVNPLLWEGPNPDTDGAGNRITGRIVLEGMRFLGPSSGASNTNSIGVRFFGVQGITTRDLTFNGWTDGEHYQNCDIVSRYNSYNQTNVNGVNSSATGYAITGAGQLNSFNTFGGLIANNTGIGISYVGGLAPSFFGVNFVANANSLVLSPNNAGGATVTVNPNLDGCYFEVDTATSLILGGGNGIVRGGKIDANFIAGAAVPMINVANYSNASGRGLVKSTFDTTFAGSSEIDQSTSAEKIDFKNLNDTPIGDITPNTGVFTKVTSGSITKSGILTTASVDILSVGTFAGVATLEITVHSTSSGVATTKKYTSLLMGGGVNTANSLVLDNTVDFGGGVSAFTLAETKDSPTTGTNKLTLTNDSAATVLFQIDYVVTANFNGTITEL